MGGGQPDKTTGRIGFVMIFLVSFLYQDKKERQLQRASNYVEQITILK
jgi:hypothetical protein